MNKDKQEALVLASASPRRREILTLLGEDFEIRPALSEIPPDPALPAEKPCWPLPAVKRKKSRPFIRTGW